MAMAIVLAKELIEFITEDPTAPIRFEDEEGNSYDYQLLWEDWDSTKECNETIVLQIKR